MQERARPAFMDALKHFLTKFLGLGLAFALASGIKTKTFLRPCYGIPVESLSNEVFILAGAQHKTFTGVRKKRRSEDTQCSTHGSGLTGQVTN